MYKCKVVYKRGYSDMKLSLLTLFSSLFQAFSYSFLAFTVLDWLTGCIKTTENCSLFPVNLPHKRGRGWGGNFLIIELLQYLLVLEGFDPCFRKS